MTVPARLAAFAAALMLVFIAAFTLGMAVGPLSGGGPGEPMPAEREPAEREPAGSTGHALVPGPAGALPGPATWAPAGAAATGES